MITPARRRMRISLELGSVFDFDLSDMLRRDHVFVMSGYLTAFDMTEGWIEIESGVTCDASGALDGTTKTYHRVRIEHREDVTRLFLRLGERRLFKLKRDFAGVLWLYDAFTLMSDWFVKYAGEAYLYDTKFAYMLHYRLFPNAGWADVRRRTSWCKIDKKFVRLGHRCETIR